MDIKIFGEEKITIHTKGIFIKVDGVIDNIEFFEDRVEIWLSNKCVCLTEHSTDYGYYKIANKEKLSTFVGKQLKCVGFEYNEEELTKHLILKNDKEILYKEEPKFFEGLDNDGYGVEQIGVYLFEKNNGKIESLGIIYGPETDGV